MAMAYKRLIGIVWLGIMLMAGLGGCRGQQISAVDSAWRPVQADPTSVEAHFALAKAYADAEQYNDAYIHYKRVVELNPSSFEATYQLARICLRLEDPHSGQQWIERALEIQPKSAEAYEVRGRLSMAAGETEEAIGNFRKALGLDSNLTVAYLNLVTAYKATGDRQAALQAAAKAVKIAPEEASTHFAYGDILQLSDRLAEAEQQYRTAIKLQDDLVPAKLHLAMLLTQQKRHLQEARELAKEVQVLEPGDGTAEATAAWALILLGEEGQGLTELYHAARAHPFNHTIWLRFAQALKQAGQEEQAKQAAAIAVRVAPRRPAPPAATEESGGRSE